MTSVVIYGGQGNVQLKHLYQMIKTEKGQKILLSLKKNDEDSYMLMQGILSKTVELNDVHASMLANFLYNEWSTNYEELVPGTIFSAHSAGIFNVLLASGSASFPDIVYFIKKRAQLIKDLQCKEELWLLMTENLDYFYQKVLDQCYKKVKLAIITDENSGVIAMNEEDSDLLESIATSEKQFYKLRKLGVKAPYHTEFLNPFLDQYAKLVEELNIVQNDSYEYIFHCENLNEELLYQWNNTFNWKKIMEKILGESKEVKDVSPNKFITKQMQKLRKREKEFG